MKWGVVVLAGGLVKDPLASALGTPRKALATIQGRTCLTRTLDAVQKAGFLDCVTVSGEDVAPYVTCGTLIEEKNTQTENARAGVEALPGVDAILFLPADSPFLQGSSLTAFAQEIERKVGDSTSPWMATGLVALDDFRKAFPRVATQPIVLKDGSYLSGALFAASPEAFFGALDLINEMSNSRANQAAMLWKLGPWTVVRYLMHQVSLSEAAQRLSRIFGADVLLATGCDPTTAADIDEVSDLDELRIHASLGSEP